MTKFDKRVRIVLLIGMIIVLLVIFIMGTLVFSTMY